MSCIYLGVDTVDYSDINPKNDAISAGQKGLIFKIITPILTPIVIASNIGHLASIFFCWNCFTAHWMSGVLAGTPYQLNDYQEGLGSFN